MYTGYKILATLQLEHEFYPDNICRDLDFVLPVETNRILASRRILVKITGGVLYLLAPLRSVGGPYLFPPEAGERIELVLGISLRRSGLARLMTAVPAHNTVLWSNTTDINTWQTRTIHLSGRMYTHDTGNAGRPLRVQLKQEGIGVDEVIIPDEAGIPGAVKITRCTFDLKQLPSGFYEIDENGTTAATIFRQDELAATGCDLLVRLRIDPCFALTEHSSFRIVPPVMKNRWVYWLVRNAGAIAPADTYTIVDNRPGVNGDKLLFDPVDNSSRQAMAARLGLSPDCILGFQTRDPASLKQAPLANLQLRKNADILIRNLPNPALHSPTNDMMIPLQ